MKKILTILCLSIFVTASYAGDILTFKNNKIFEGKVLKIKNNEIVFKTNNNRYFIPASDIISIQFENTKDEVYIDLLKIAQNDSTTCQKAEFDAKNYHGKEVTHFVLGFFFGPVAIMGTLMSSPSPEKGKKTGSMSVNKELFADPEYLKCYTKKAERQLVGAEIIGFVVSSVTFWMVNISYEII